MQRRIRFACEAAYALGILVLALGTALMERADFGMSMVVAPAYLIHLKVSQYVPAYTFGMSEYVFQALLLVALSLLTRRFKRSCLLSFVTAVLYGFALDLAIRVVGCLPLAGLAGRVGFFLAGLLVSATGVALFFHTYLPPEAYELFVKEVSARFNKPISATKTVYDACSFLLGVLLSFAFFGFGVFVGVKWGTVVCTLVNGWLIGRISRWLEARFAFYDALPWRERIGL